MSFPAHSSQPLKCRILTVCILRRYVATLEARIRSLEKQLRAESSGQDVRSNSADQDMDCSESRVPEGDASAPEHLEQQYEETTGQDARGTSFQRTKLNDPQTSSSDITILDILHGRSLIPESGEALPVLPPERRARVLVDTVYFYTQARYCIINWVQLRDWQKDQQAIAYTSTEGPIAAQTGNKDPRS